MQGLGFEGLGFWVQGLGFHSGFIGLSIGACSSAVVEFCKVLQGFVGSVQG